MKDDDQNIAGRYHEKDSRKHHSVVYEDRRKDDWLEVILTELIIHLKSLYHWRILKFEFFAL